MQYGKNFIIALISIMLGLALSEGIVRLFYPQQLSLVRPDVYCADSTIGWRHCPNVTTIINTGEGEVSYHSDKLGYRINPLHNHEKPDISILFIGDSFTEALQVNDDATTPEVVASLLETKYTKKIFACNAGVGDWDPNQYLIQAKQELFRNSYDIGLIFLYIGNDIVSEIKTVFPPRKSAYHHFRAPISFTKKEMVDSILYPINDFLKSHSQLYVLLKNACTLYLMRLGLTGFSIAPVFYKDNESIQAFDITANICMDIRDEFTRYRIPVIFVLIPTDYQVNPVSYNKLLQGFNVPRESIDLDQPNRIFKKFTHKSGLEVIDPLDEMRSIDATGKKLYGTIDNHLNAAGYRVLAEQLMPDIESRLRSELIGR